MQLCTEHECMDVQPKCRPHQHQRISGQSGDERQGTDVSRLGYCAMANGNIVLGISRSDKVKDYVEERGGSFFRQFIFGIRWSITSQVPTSRKGGVPCLGKNFRRPLILYRDPSSRNPLGFRRCPARIRFRRCYLHHR